MTALALPKREVKTVHAYEDDSALASLLGALLADPDGSVDRGMLEEFGSPWGSDFAYLGGGDLVLLSEGGRAVAGGAYRRYDSTTAQLGWLWTRPDRRRTGLGRQVLGELESSAIWRGYDRVYAVAGPGQNSARELFAVGGYRAVGRRVSEDEYLGFVRMVGWED
ncbi:MAG TPA: GNAT family N-acetyltransferase [Actinocrinis sp.]|nr:GNAT family N-acetyltransferase [Actinocrinis sp.]